MNKNVITVALGFVSISAAAYSVPFFGKLQFLTWLHIILLATLGIGVLLKK